MNAVLRPISYRSKSIKRGDSALDSSTMITFNELQLRNLKAFAKA